MLKFPALTKWGESKYLMDAVNGSISMWNILWYMMQLPEL